jgi:hypothetical protein
METHPTQFALEFTGGEVGQQHHGVMVHVLA